MKKKRVNLKTGDVLLIPLSETEAAIAQLVYHETNQGSVFKPLIRVIKGTFPNDEALIDLDEIDLTDQLFPPICTGVGAAVREGLYKKIGNRPVENFTYPKFISTNYLDDGLANIWYLSDDKSTEIIGETLPEQYKSLEYEVVLSPFDVIDRIISGEITFPYGDLIKYNKFTPRHKRRKITKEEKDKFSKDVFGKKRS